MTNHTADLTQIIRALETLLAQVRTMAGVIEEPKNAPTVAERMERRECLRCARIALDDEEYIRGLGPECYGTTMRRIRDGEEDEAVLIQEGKLAIRKRPGRRATIDMQIDARMAKREAELSAANHTPTPPKRDRKKRK